MKKRQPRLRRSARLLALAAVAAAGCERVEVTTVEVARVEVSPPSVTVTVNGTARLTAGVLGRDGAPLPGRSVAWSSLEPSIAEVDATGLVRGLAAGTARIQASAEGAADTATVSVTARAPVIAASPTSLSFTASQGAANPSSRSVAITEVEGESLTGINVEIAYPSGQPAGWATTSLASSAAPTTLTVGAVTGTLPAGTYTATVRILAAAAANSPLPVQVEFVVQQPLPAIALSRPNATFSTTLLGGDPAAVQITISNGGAGSVSGLAHSISYTAGQPAGWLSAQLGGTTAPTTLTLTASKGSLPAGTYTANVRLTSSTAVNSPVDIPVSFAIAVLPPGAPSNLQATAASPSQIDLSWNASAGEVERYRIERRSGSGGGFVAIDSVGGGTHSFRDSGLNAGAQYIYRLQACNAVGCSTYSNEASATTSPVAPGVPPNLQAAAVSSTRIDLTWHAAAGSVERYRIERRVGGGAFQPLDSVAAGTLAYQDGGLTAGTQYTYRVQACNAAGCSDFSNQAQATTPQAQAPPGAPSGLQANAISSSRIDVEWSAATGTVAEYRIERSTGGADFAPLATVGGSTLRYENTGLAAATQYSYRVRACNDVGCSAYSNTATATTQAPPLAPSRPTNLTATGASTSRIDLAWEHDGLLLDRFEIQRAPGNNNFTTIHTTLTGVPRSYADEGLSAGTTYRYRIRACNVACSDWSSTAEGTTLAASGTPDVPTNFTVEAISPTEARLSWTAPGGQTHYRVRRGTGNNREEIDVDGAATSYIWGGLQPGSTERFQVAACNGNNCSQFSSQVTITMPGG